MVSGIMCVGAEGEQERGGNRDRQYGPALSLKSHCHKKVHPVAKPTAGLKRDDCGVRRHCVSNIVIC